MSDRKDVQALLRDGIEEARLRNRDTAREILRQVVTLDPDNEKGWFWLASVSNSDEEKREYLERVLVINPENDTARRVLEKINERTPEIGASDEVVPGVSRRTLTVVVGFGAVVVIAVLAFVALTLINDSRREAENAAATQVVFAAQTETAFIAAAAVAAETERVVVEVTEALEPTATPTVSRPARTPVPTWTPTFTPTPPELASLLYPTPEGLVGSLAGWSGRDIQNIDFLPVGAFDLQTGTFRPATASVGRDVRVHPSGQRIIYTRYDQVLFDTLIESVSLNGSDAESIAERWREFGGPLSIQMPDYSADGSRVVFVGEDPQTAALQVYMIDLSAPATGVSPLQRLTNDRANYTYPAFSPDSARIAVVRDDIGGAQPGPDIVLIDVATLQATPLTTDLSTFVETSPRWSPDGQQIVYAAAPANDPENSDIALRAAAGYGLPVLPVRSEANDIFPVFSPDGRYLAFSSNRNGQYDIYVYDFRLDSLSQLTNTPDEDYPGGWR